MYESNLTVLDKVLSSGEIYWPQEAQQAVSGPEEGRRANHGIWNSTIAQFEQIRLWDGQVPNWDDAVEQPVPSLIFLPCRSETPRGTVIVAHGGAFVMRAGHEGFVTARRFLEFGLNVAVLTYRLVPYTRWDALADMQQAIRVLRSLRGQLHITDKVAVMGFSAGGMLSGNAATHFDPGDPDAVCPVARQSSRPDAAVLCYGAFAGSSYPGRVLADDPFTDPNRMERVYFATEKNITVDTPPFFIWQTISDDPRHGLALAKELTDCGVPFELHLFPDGHHGVGLGDGNNDSGERFPHLAHWSMLAGEWLAMQGL